jgi:chromosome segregation ATPase
MTADRTDDEALRLQLKQTEDQLAEVTRNRDELKQQLTTLTADRQQVAAQLDRKSEEFDRKCEELEELKRNPPPAVNSGKIDSDQTGEIVNFLKELLPPDTKWPKKTIPTLRKFLEAAED